MFNPDHEFVLLGRKSHIREKPSEFHSNSSKTNTSRNLSHSQLFTQRGSEGLEGTCSNKQLSPEKDTQNDDQSWENTEKSELSLDLGSLNSSLNKSFNKSVSFSKKLGRTMIEGGCNQDDDDVNLLEEFKDELQRLIDSELDDSDKNKDLVGKPLSPNDTAWFTEPPHLTKNVEFPVFEQLGIKEETISSVRRPTGITGTELAQRMIASDCCSVSEEAREYFPVTLGEIPSIMRTVTPLSLPVSERNARNVQSKRKNNKTPYDTPKQQATSDYNYLKASQAFLDQSVVATPYQYELAKLKMERLRLEEQRLLSMKRDNELERIRGPEPKWYELKTPKFTYEHSKNNKLLKSEKDWQDLLNYRSQLLNSSQRFRTATT